MYVPKYSAHNGPLMQKELEMADPLSAPTGTIFFLNPFF